MRKRVQSADAELGRLVEEAHRSGELEHLYGKPLDLEDDSPEWFARKMLKDAGFTHPLVDRAREIDAARQEAEEPVLRLRERYARLAGSSARPNADVARRFNERRQEGLDEYRRRLVDLNRAIRDYNLSAPSSMHRRAIEVEGVVRAAADEVPPLTVAGPQMEPPKEKPPTRFRRLLRRTRRDRG